MFYLLRSEYAGPNRDQFQGSAGHYLTIATEPGRTNMGGNILTEGWLGTTNDWYAYAHGEFETLPAAQEAADALGYSITIDPPYGCDGEPTLVEFRATLEDARMQVAAADWFGDVVSELGITAITTDAELEALAEREANTELENKDSDHPYGIQVNGLLEFLRDHRNDLRADATIWGLMKYSKAMLENYDYRLCAEFLTEEAAREALEAEESNAVSGYELVYTDEEGCHHYDGDLFPVGGYIRCC